MSNPPGEWKDCRSHLPAWTTPADRMSRFICCTFSVRKLGKKKRLAALSSMFQSNTPLWGQLLGTKSSDHVATYEMLHIYIYISQKIHQYKMLGLVKAGSIPVPEITSKPITKQ